MIYGYCRISTRTQSIQRQIRNIQEIYPEALIIKETYTGTTSERPAWEKLVKKVQAGDTIIFDSVSRMSRSAAAGFKDYKALYEKGVRLVFIKEPLIDTDTYRGAMAQQIGSTGTDVDLILAGVNQFLLRLAEKQVQLAFEQSEKEVEDLRQRTREGLITARKNGKKLGRRAGHKIITDKSIQAKKVILKKAKEFGGTYTDKDLIAVLGISSGTYYKYKRELRTEPGQLPGQMRLPV